MKDLYTETRRINIVKNYRAIYIFSALLIKIPMAFFSEIEQKKIKFVWNNKRS